MFTLRDYQQDAVAQAFKHLTNAELPGCKPVICLPTGAVTPAALSASTKWAICLRAARDATLMPRP